MHAQIPVLNPWISQRMVPPERHKTQGLRKQELNWLQFSRSSQHLTAVLLIMSEKSKTTGPDLSLIHI